MLIKNKLHILHSQLFFPMARHSASILLFLGLPMSGASYADHEVDEIVIVGESQLVENRVTIEGDALRIANTADFLKNVPGANLNRNGPLTALPQYRGATGDRVSVIIDGMPVVSSGPNAMDAPVSSIPGANLKSLSVSRGIASVSVGQQTLGGHVVVTSRNGDYSESDTFDAHARVSALYGGNNDALHSNVLTYLSSDQHKVGVAFSYDEGDNAEFSENASSLTGGNEISNSFFDRKRVSAFYGFQSDDFGMDLNVASINTNDTGTAALPMDIIFIDSESLSGNFFAKLNDWQVDFQLGFNNVEHGMNNYDHREPSNMVMMGGMGMMVMPMNRYNFAEGDHQNSKLALTGPLFSGEIAMGIDYSKSVYDSNIVDPTNGAFFLKNFNNVQKTITGFFAEWINLSDSISWELGARVNQVESSADAVDAGGAPMMVAMNVMPLVMSFNQSDRNFDENNTDLVAKMAVPIFNRSGSNSARSETTFSVGLARKTRAPSYQALYLWIPLQATGGLADGRNYVGNLDLKSEIANELNVGLDHSFDVGDASTAISFQMFYREVNDYIQGTTDINSPFAMQMTMLSNMMGGKDPLQYNNVDATLYGADVGYNGSVGSWYYRGNLSYVRGERDDISDNLYRIAPLNHSLTVGKHIGDLDLSLTSELVAAQNKVSSYNDEEKTAGYGLLNANLRWQATPQLQAVLGVDNVLDKNYEAHLNGYNRVANADIAKGERLKGMGRNIRVGVSYAF